MDKSNMIYPELFAEAVEGSFASNPALMGANTAKLGIVKAEGSFPQSGPDKIGNLVSVPYFGSLGEFQSRTDGVAASNANASMGKEQGTVDCGTLPFKLTTWANATPVPGKSPYEEYARQIMEASERWMDLKCITAAVSGNNQLINDVFSSSSPVNFGYDLLVDSLGLWGDFGALDQVAAIAMHSKTMIDMLKVKDSTGKPIFVAPTLPGVPPTIFGIPVIVSDRCPIDDNGTMSAVTSAGTSPPVITLTNTTNRLGGTGPCRPVNLKVKATLGGARGTWTFQVSIDGGATYFKVPAGIATIGGLDYVSAATVALYDPFDPALGLLGITLNIASGSATNDNTWAAKSVLKHTTLLLKKNSIAFWYNAKYAGVLQSVPVPQEDAVQYAAHLYSVAHRYVRMPGQPYPGVVAIRHNAAGL